MLAALDSSAFARRSAPLARVALAAAALLAALALLRVLGTLAFGPEVEPVAPVRLEDAGAAAPAPAQSVAAWHLFGNGAAPIDLAQLAQAAPATALKLTLRGTLNENAPEGGVAIIADEAQVDRAYRVGDTLPGDARLEGIYAGRVLLSRAGVNESLSLPTQVSGDAPAPGGGMPGAPGVDPMLSQALGGNLPGAQAPAPFVAPVIGPTAPSLDSFRNNLGTDPAALAKEVQIFPVIENGRMAGVRLSAGRDSDILARAGLRPSDIVTAVNGIPLDGPQRSAELRATLKDARRVQVTVRRDGQDVQLAIGL